MDAADSGPGQPGRPKRPYLKRGEGVQRRVFAPLTREKKLAHKQSAEPDELDHMSTSTACTTYQAPIVPSKYRQSVVAVQSRHEPQHQLPREQAASGRDMQYATRTQTLCQVDGSDQDLELEEFRALEELIRADLYDQTQQKVNSASSKLEPNSCSSDAKLAGLAVACRTLTQTTRQQVLPSRPGAGAFDDADSWAESTQLTPAPSKQNSVAVDSRSIWSNTTDVANHNNTAQVADTRDSQQGHITQPFVRSLFHKDPASVRLAARMELQPDVGLSDEELAKHAALDEERASLAAEKVGLARMRTEIEKTSNRLEQERLAWQRHMAGERAAFQAQCEAELQKLKRERRVLDKQSKALLKMPNKQERSALHAAEAVLAAERAEGKARDARHKLTVERLRRQIVELQTRTHELEEEIRWYETQQLANWQGPLAQFKPPSASCVASNTTKTQQHSETRTSIDEFQQHPLPTATNNIPNALNSQSHPKCQWHQLPQECACWSLAKVDDDEHDDADLQTIPTPDLDQSELVRHSELIPSSPISHGISEDLSSCGNCGLHHDLQNHVHIRNSRPTGSAVCHEEQQRSQVAQESIDKWVDCIQAPLHQGQHRGTNMFGVKQIDPKLQQHQGGPRVVNFPNGTCKVSAPDGSITILFANGDIKEQFSNGQVDYYYAEVDTWHCTHQNKVEVFYFPNGQCEAHHPDGYKEVIFPDGALRCVLANGQEQALMLHDLSGEVRLPRPIAKQFGMLTLPR